MEDFAQIILLLGVAIAVVVFFQRLRIPTSLGYLLVGIILGPHTAGPSVYSPEFEVLGTFGVVFLLFTIGLDFTLPQLYALRHNLLWLGGGQVFLTTLFVSLIGWFAGLQPGPAFIIGAVFAQSSSTIMSSLLSEQGEANSRHGRLGIAMSVFQDVMAIPFLLIIPVLGISSHPDLFGTTQMIDVFEGVFSIVSFFIIGRWLLRPLFHFLTFRHSAETFTLAVLLVALLAAWTTDHFGLSLAFGGFLAGMMLGETEFRHQVESSIRPFRDVLLGLFFIGIGMRFDPGAVPPIWHWALLGGVLIVAGKLLIVTLLVRRMNNDFSMSLRTGLLMSVGGEFGLALVSIALDSKAISVQLGQIAITSVLLSLVAGGVLIRFNGRIAAIFEKSRPGDGQAVPELQSFPAQQVLLGGYGRVGKTVAELLKAGGIPFMVIDADPRRVAEGRQLSLPISYGDMADPELLSSVRVERASLVIITVEDPEVAIKILSYMTRYCPQVPVITRAPDLESSRRLVDAGAVDAYPESVEASLRLGALALRVLEVSNDEIDQLLQMLRSGMRTGEGGVSTG